MLEHKRFVFLTKRKRMLFLYLQNILFNLVKRTKLVTYITYSRLRWK